MPQEIEQYVQHAHAAACTQLPGTSIAWHLCGLSRTWSSHTGVMPFTKPIILTCTLGQGGGPGECSESGLC